MLSSVLNSKQAVKSISRSCGPLFAYVRSLLQMHSLSRKLDALEKKYDAQFKVVFDPIRQLMAAPGTEQTEDRISS